MFKVVAFSMGSAKSGEVLRTALAKGADKAIHVELTDAETATVRDRWVSIEKECLNRINLLL